MKVLHICNDATRQKTDAIFHLEELIKRLRAGKVQIENWEAFEKELHEIVVNAERELLAEGLARLDVDLPSILVEGKLYRRVMRAEATYTSAAGPVRVDRALYSTREYGARTICPLEMRAGIIGGHWTPTAAKQGNWAVSHMSPQEAADLFEQLGNMTPSKSSLDRLPKVLSERWEEHREQFETVLRSETVIPRDAVTLAVSLDGVMAPMKDGQRQKKRAQAKADGKRVAGPAGYQEVGCATASFYDAQGKRLSTVRFARMPEPDKATLKSMGSIRVSQRVFC